MNEHKKKAKELHVQIKKDKKTVDLYKDKIGKLSLEKEKLENKLNLKKEDRPETYEIQYLKNEILREISEKREIEEKIKEIKEDYILTKHEMGGLNAIQQTQEKYEKHIKILENRLDKANQKFNQCIEEDKILREEIDRLRKERYFFENIYKRLDKDIEKVREEISGNLGDAYKNYESRDKNQEEFERIKEAMASKETDYANKLSNIANDMNMRNSRKKPLDNKENMNKMRHDEEENLYKTTKKNKELREIQYKKLLEVVNNMKFKFEKIKEFTHQESVEALTTKFRDQAEENYQLFCKITEISKEAKESEKEIKELEDEILSIKNSRDGMKSER